MGTTLTGTTPQDTYDSLIKVTDNGPISGTAKFLSDGLGNDSVLALSTSRVTIGGTNPYVGLLTIYGTASLSGGFGLRNSAGTAAGFLATYAAGSGSGSTDMSIGSAGFLEINTAGVERMRITSTGNVGIGTSSPLAKLNVSDASLSNIGITASGEATDQKNWFYQYGPSVGAGTFRLRAVNDAASNGQNAVIITRTGFNVDTHQFLTSGSERFRITDNGVTFNGDTAAANALDDYEEGTFTPTAFGLTTAGTTTYNVQNGWYTKIGRQVNITLFVSYSALTGTGGFRIGALPFTSASLSQNFAVGAVNLSNMNWTGGSYVTALQVPNTTTIALYGSSDDGVAVEQDCVNEDTSIRITITYFV
jgi:hypothetical protein